MAGTTFITVSRGTTAYRNSAMDEDSPPGLLSFSPDTATFTTLKRLPIELFADTPLDMAINLMNFETTIWENIRRT